MNRLKKRNRFFPVLLLAYIAVMLVSIFYDYSITAKLAEHNSKFWDFFSAIGEFPGFAAFPFLGCVTIMLIICVIKRRRSDFVRKLALIAIFWAVSTVVTVAVTEPVKIFWGRPRFLDLNSEVLFSPWYKPCGNTGFRSFYSGHTAMASMSYTAIYALFCEREKPSAMLPAALILCSAFVLLTGLSRLFAGAHFLSDVLTGAFSGIAIQYAVYKFVMPKVSGLVRLLV